MSSSKPSARKRIPVRYSRLFGALENMIAGFEPAPGIEPFRVPSEPKSLNPLIHAFFGEDVDPVEVWNDLPIELLDLIIGCGWGGGPGGSSSDSIWMVTLPSRRHVYVHASDYSGIQILAATGPLFTSGDTVRFLELLAEDNGARFGVGVIGGAPEEFSIGVKAPREKLIDLTYNLFANAGELGTLRDDTDWTIEIPQPPRPRIPAWEKQLRKEFGPITGFAAGMGFNALRRRYMEKHGITVPPPPPWPEEKEYSDREVVELWLQSQNVIEKSRQRKAAAKRRSR